MSFKTDEWDVTRPLPFSLPCEKSTLSTLLNDPVEFIPLAVEMGVTSDHFYLPAHARLFGFLLELSEAGQEIELVSLTQRLLDKGLLDRIGGPAALADLHTYSPSNAHFKRQVEILREKQKARAILSVSNGAIAAVYDSPDNIQTTLERLESEVMAIRDDVNTVGRTVKQAVAVAIERLEDELNHKPSAKGLSTGFEEWDRMGGLKESEMIVIGARPSMGKTACLMNIVEHACVDGGIPCLVFSAEMSTDSIVDRMIYSRARFSRSQLLRGYAPNKGDLQRIHRASTEIAAAPLFIDDKSGPTIGYIRAKARRMVREHGIRLIGIDYLQLCKGESKQSVNSREREIAEISAGLKALAKDLGIPVVVLAQLNRSVEKRGKGDGKTALPVMSDLRESGSIEQDADQIALLWRADYQGEEDTGEACLDLAKNRNGPTGRIPLTFIKELARFESGRPAPEPEPHGFGR
jgi:replicative DNA helicase